MSWENRLTIMQQIILDTVLFFKTRSVLQNKKTIIISIFNDDNASISLYLQLLRSIWALTILCIKYIIIPCLCKLQRIFHPCWCECLHRNSPLHFQILDRCPLALPLLALILLSPSILRIAAHQYFKFISKNSTIPSCRCYPVEMQGIM